MALIAGALAILNAGQVLRLEHCRDSWLGTYLLLVYVRRADRAPSSP